jgi:hypothetical protein
MGFTVLGFIKTKAPKGELFREQYIINNRTTPAAKSLYMEDIGNSRIAIDN